MSLFVVQVGPHRHLPGGVAHLRFFVVCGTMGVQVGLCSISWGG